ncbi:SLATT domain-containing protein [Oculatella sp. FACHB-28]|uniref:SLATT domain-containing protein n=1 Tax=Oculatella sp. FACHB-28 TaxID=2692845 RepID=UPI00168677BE|nr:SLATT domain-containing protein [Oculatella sp. FACHB-28]MBD2054605.1 SLATT domain-containing protein [Oculatella sp. FACHB-28]
MDNKALVLREIEENELYALILAKGHYDTAIAWGNVHLYLGMPNTTFAALAGASALSSFDNSNLIAGILSIIAAILAAVSTFLNPSDRAKSHLKASHDFERLYKRIKMLRINAFDDAVTMQELAPKFDALLEQFYDLRDASPAVPDWAYRGGAMEAEVIRGKQKQT